MAKETKLNQAMAYMLSRLAEHEDDELQTLSDMAINDFELLRKDAKESEENLVKKALKSPAVIKALTEIMETFVAHTKENLRISDEDSGDWA